MKEEEDFALAGLVLIVDSRTNFMLAVAARTDLYLSGHCLGARHWFGLQYLI